MMGPVLVVDDDNDVREVISIILEAAGVQVEAAADGDEALAFLRDGPTPSLVLLDLRMPGLDGEEFLRVARRYLSQPGLKVVLMSGDAHAIQIARSAGTAFLQKPLQLDDLLALVRPSESEGLTHTPGP